MYVQLIAMPDGTVTIRLYRAGPQLGKPVILRLSDKGGSATGACATCAHTKHAPIHDII